MKNTLVLLALLLVSSLAYAGPVEDVATGLSSLLFQEADRYFDDRFDPYGGGPSGPQPFGGQGPYSDPFSAPSAGGPFGGGPFGAPQHNNLLAGKGLVRSRVSALMTSLRAVAHPLALTLLTFPQSSLHQFRLKKFWREKSGTLFSANSTHF
ncbi:MAG: hypothetical protein J4224_00435 [Candidatus Diapherotrites archaeon]|uniref:Uncharacterized protein n=1 Tax=Candidatus Iainarchaeum sp. TaxID=3101447 RepID=A0A8T4L7E1_9ARCH|nr:hypothetical protein [Candidatus Diapherotrites archaeon]